MSERGELTFIEIECLGQPFPASAYVLNREKHGDCSICIPDSISSFT